MRRKKVLGVIVLSVVFLLIGLLIFYEKNLLRFKADKIKSINMAYLGKVYYVNKEKDIENIYNVLSKNKTRISDASLYEYSEGVKIKIILKNGKEEYIYTTENRNRAYRIFSNRLIIESENKEIGAMINDIMQRP